MTNENDVFLTRCGRHGEDEEHALAQGLTIIGFRDVASLEDTTDYQGILARVREGYPDGKPGAHPNYAGQLNTFVHEMKEGDTVVLPLKQTSQIALGRVSGPYRYKEVNGVPRHTREVDWIQTDLPRTTFEQDLLYSFGAFMTVCRIKRNQASKRIQTVIEGRKDPGGAVNIPLQSSNSINTEGFEQDGETETLPDLSQLAHDQIVAHIQSRFSGHALSDLVNAVLEADGWVTKVSPPGADGGVDVLAGRGPLGLDPPRLCVQVKSQDTTADVTVYRSLQGSMQTYKADQGLLVCWGGFNNVVTKEAKQGHFAVRLWGSSDLVQAIYRNYSKLPAEIQADLPLKQTWVLVLDEGDS